tara:strand:+ start:118 stop:1032 length:915 start_codon:yes stop_codon:yes gene_type:complete
MKKSLIVRIAEGLGNQMFMYANALSVSKNINYKLYVDDKSAYFKKKDIRSFELNNFNITGSSLDDKYKFNNEIKNFKRKFLIKFDLFRTKKNFIIESKFKNKQTKYSPIDTRNLSDLVYVEGNYESEKYFISNRNNLLKEFEIKNKDKLIKNKYFDMINKNKDRIISICVRTNRYSERIKNSDNLISKSKSDEFTQNNIEYIKRAIKQFPIKIEKPLYLLWSNDFSNLNEYFPKENFIFIKNDHNKVINDFFLLTLCKNFIVGPTSFHWWGAWLSQHNDKICIKPKNINQSSNIDFWPNNWIPL